MKAFLQKYIPIYSTLCAYKRSALQADITAGLTIGIVLIPQGMAYAVIADLPPIYGLYASLVPLLIYPVFATSRHLSVGPVALDMLILAAGLGLVVGGDTAEKISLAIAIAMLTGIFQILMGLLKLGFIFDLFSRPVISGFTSAAAIIIIFSQLGSVLKIDVETSYLIVEIATNIYSRLELIHWPSLFISLVFIVFLLAVRRFFKTIPEAAAAVLLALAIAYFIDLQAYGISQIESIPEGLPRPEFNIPDYDALRGILPTVFTLALIQFMSVAALTKSFARKHGYVINPNQELIAIGSANLVGSLFKSIPVSGSFSRSAIGERAGAATALSNVFAALLILLTLLFLTPVFETLPKTLLAAVIIVSVANLVDVREFMLLLKTKQSDALVAIVTFFSVLFIGIQQGIILGIITSVVAILVKLSRPTVAELGVLPNSWVFKNIDRYKDAEMLEGIMILRIDAPLSFINAEYFKAFIMKKSFSREDKPSVVIIDGSTIVDLDISAVDVLNTIKDSLNKNGIELYISGLIGPVRDIIHGPGKKVFDQSEHCFYSLREAAEHAQAHIKSSNTQGNKISED